ncbi:MAG: discoidin domain-containing protein, partial [Armatimonadota bacterium]
AYGGGADGQWTVREGQYYAACTDPPRTIHADYSPGQVLSGVTRQVGDNPNLWASDPDEPLPQWIELRWEQPVAIGTVELTFDTDLNTRRRPSPTAPECVRDYELSCLIDGQWRTVAEVEGNFRRKRVHRFSAVTTRTLRLTVHATNGAPSARVFEVRAYGPG